jgi:DUF4097 and DUF4098 domain-containing protein YvlB
MKIFQKPCVALAIIVLTSGLLLAETIEERFEKTVPLEYGGYFALSNKNGSIEISSWDREEVRIEALKKVKSSSRHRAREAMEDLRIEIDTRGNDEVIVETDYPYDRGGESLGGVLSAILGGHEKPQISVSYRITVPERIDLKIGTTNGSIDVEDIEGEARVSSTNGRVDMSNMKGFLDVSTTNGRIELADIDGGLAAGTTNGSVEVRYSSRADITEDISIRTTNGGIELRLPEDVDADVDARTTNGHIDTDFPITVRGRYGKKQLSGQINDGGPLIELKTTNGSINIRASRSRM